MAYQMDSIAEDFVLPEIKQEIKEECELEAESFTGEPDETSFLGCPFSSSELMQIKQEVQDEDDTWSFADDSCTRPLLNLVPVNASPQPVTSVGKARSRVAKDILENRYQCNLCAAKFPCGSRLKSHVVNEHKQRDRTILAYRCAICCDAFPDVDKLRYHMTRHVNVNVPSKSRKRVKKSPRVQSENVNSTSRKTARLHSCEICGKSVVDLRKHLQTHSGTRARPQACGLCGKVVNDMYKHKKVHLRQSLPAQTCEICGESVVEIWQHMQEHQLNLQSCETVAKTEVESQPHEQSGLWPCEATGESVGNMEGDLEKSGGELLQSETCNVCGEFAADMRSHRQMHQETAHRVFRPCNICGKVVSDMYRHRKIHTGKSMTLKSCEVCGKVVADLYRHRKMHSGLASQLRPCIICGKYVVDMYKHKLMHRGVQRPLRKCTICGKSVKELWRHMQIHNGSQRWETCNVCGKVVSNLRVHERTHSEQRRQFECTLCGRCFLSNASLKRHLEVHSGQKKFVCAECGRRYITKTALSTHMWIHSVEPRHQCTVCSKAFRSLITWKRHLWTHGIGMNKTHNCPVCSKYFASSYLLKEHMRTHSGEKPYVCMQCGTRFGHKSSLYIHQKCSHSSDMASCPECGKMIRAPRMSDHMRVMHPDILHRCSECYLEFRQQDWLDWHMLCHSGTQLYLCDDCNDINNDSVIQSFDHLTTTDDLDSCVRPDCDTNAEVTTVINDPRPNDGVTSLEMKSSGTEPRQLPSDDSVAQNDDVTSQTAADEAASGNRLSVVNENLVDSVSRSIKKELEMDGFGWNTSTADFVIPPDEYKDRCIRCNKLRPHQQCPVCHLMYPLVAVHIGVHSIRKIHTRASLLEGLTTIDDVSNSDQSRPSDQTHLCTDCGEILANAKALRSHSKNCLKFAICMVCGITCGNGRKLRTHMKTHKNANTVKDKDDDSGTRKPEDMSCTACEVDFDGVESLMQHMEEHMDEERRMCRVCGKTFTNVDSLKSHMRSHTGKMHFQCETCGKSCRTPKALNEHRVVHSAEKPYMCTVCGKQFRLKKNYMRHRVIHSTDKNYPCKFCGMKFWFNYQRSRHMLVHTGEKPYVCNRCGDRFRQWNGLAQHRLRSCRK